jgi:hypothetical protein
MSWGDWDSDGDSDSTDGFLAGAFWLGPWWIALIVAMLVLVWWLEAA